MYQLGLRHNAFSTAAKTKYTKNGKRLACNTWFRYTAIFQHAKTIGHGLQTKNEELINSHPSPLERDNKQ
ncbi:MAG: hypothetical protein D3909_08835 [Candidatus Electrothrix sp. ATG1]|nr:hypothetical protein [Candidatus Electrothrix sp. ATG1]